MKKTILALVTISIVSTFLMVENDNPQPLKRSAYTEFLAQHPYSEIMTADQLKELPKKDRPDLAMRQNFLMTMDPATKQVPRERLFEAFESQRSQLLTSRSALLDGIPGVTWEERGPNNFGGRTRALMWDPNDSETKKLWAGGVAGGIWFNNDVTDVDSSWEKIDDFLANLAISAFAYDPNNTQVFYAGTGEGYFNADAVRGAGIYKSTDGGINWALIPSTEISTFHYVQNIVVTEAGTVLASTRNGGLQRSEDGGDTWSTVLSNSSPGVSSSRANDLEIAANGDIYATMGIFSAGSIHRSTDDGVNWTTIDPGEGTSPERIEIAVSQSVSEETENTVIFALASSSSDVAWFKKP